MPQVVVEMTAEEAKLWRAQQRIIAQTKRLEDGYSKVRRSAKKTSDTGVAGATKQSQTLMRVGQSLTNLATSYASVQTALSLYNMHLEQNISLSQKSIEMSQRIAEAQQEALKNMSALTQMEASSIVARRATEIQAVTGFGNRAELIRTIGAGFGTGARKEDVLRAVEAAARVTMLTPQNVGIVAEGALDLASATGVKDARKNIGFLLSAGAINRIVDPAQLARTLAPTVRSGIATAPAQDAQEAAKDVAALFGTLAKATTDREGRSTRTFVEQLLPRMREFFAGRADDPGTVLGRIKALQGDEQLRKAFLESRFGEAKFRLPLEQILTPGSEVAKELDVSRGQVKFTRDTYKDLLKRLMSTPELVTATAKVRVAAAKELMTTPKEGVTEVVRELFEAVLEKTGDDAVRDVIERRVFKDVVDAGRVDPITFGRRKFTRMRQRFEGLVESGEVDRAKGQEWIRIVDMAISQIEQLADSMEKLNRESAANAARKQQAQHGAVEAQ